VTITREDNLTSTTLRGLAILTAAACGIMFSGIANAQEKLTVWWVKGFYKAEDEALYEAIKKYEAKSGVKVDLSQYAV
jgi:multiple sugar transport system substrate-binding protein